MRQVESEKRRYFHFHKKNCENGSDHKLYLRVD